MLDPFLVLPVIALNFGRQRKLKAGMQRGKSGLHRAAQGVTPLHRKVRNSGTERMSRALSLEAEIRELLGELLE